MNDGLDVDRIAAKAEALGLVSPDTQGPEEDGDEVVVIVHIHGGCLADVGASEVAGLRVVVVDDDVLDDGESDGVWTEPVGDLRHWSREEDAALMRAASELPEALRRELGIANPTPRSTQQDG